MWRCRCGESNLSRDARCRSCEAARATAELTNPEYRPPRRWKAVQVGFFGMGIEDPRGEDAAGESARWSEEELDVYYRRAARQSRWHALRIILVVLAVLLVILLQVFRRD